MAGPSSWSVGRSWSRGRLVTPAMAFSQICHENAVCGKRHSFHAVPLSLKRANKWLATLRAYGKVPFCVPVMPIDASRWPIDCPVRGSGGAVCFPQTSFSWQQTRNLIARRTWRRSLVTLGTCRGVRMPARCSIVGFRVGVTNSYRAGGADGLGPAWPGPAHHSVMVVGLWGLAADILLVEGKLDRLGKRQA